MAYLLKQQIEMDDSEDQQPFDMCSAAEAEYTLHACDQCGEPTLCKGLMRQDGGRVCDLCLG